MKRVVYVASRGPDGTPGFWSPVGRLEHDEGLFRFVYTEGAERLPGFRPFPEMDDLHGVYESESLFPLFANRLLSPSRPEYESFLRWSGFDPAQPPEPLALLGVTQGLRQTDWIEVFPCPTQTPEGRFTATFFLHGLRWMPPAAHERVASLKLNEELRLLLEIGNPADAQAVAVCTSDREGRYLIGYVPRYLAADVRSLCETCDPDQIELAVRRVNPTAPLQQRLLLRFECCWPDGFDPCGDAAFKPLAPLSPPTANGNGPRRRA